MSLKAMKCPSCGADIELDDDREFGFCSYCGSQIQIGDKINIHVTHEYKGEAPHVNVTNQYFYGEQDAADHSPRSNIVIEKPGGKKLGWGIALAVIGIVGLCSSAEKGMSYIALCIIFIAVSVFLLVSYYRSMKLYNEAVRKAGNGDAVFREKDNR